MISMEFVTSLTPIFFSEKQKDAVWNSFYFTGILSIFSNTFFFGMCLIWKEKKARSNMQVLNISDFFYFFFLQAFKKHSSVWQMHFVWLVLIDSTCSYKK